MGRNKFKGSDRQDKKMVKRNKSLGLPTNKDEGFCPFAQVDQSYGSAAPYTHTVGIASSRRTVPRTVNGTGHTGPSEFCATSI